MSRKQRTRHRSLRAGYNRATAFCTSLRVASIDAISFSEGAPTSTATTFPARSTLQVVLKPSRADDAGGMAVEQVRSPSILSSIRQPALRSFSTPAFSSAPPSFRFRWATRIMTLDVPTCPAHILVSPRAEPENPVAFPPIADSISDGWSNLHAAEEP